MNIGRTLTITKRILRGLKNDWRAVMMMFITPIIGITVFGVAFSDDVNSVEVVVVNQDEGYQIPPSTVPVSIADAVVANFDADVLKVIEVDTEAEGVALVKDGKAYALIIFSKDFTHNVYAKAVDPSQSVDTAIRLEMDRSNVAVANSILKTVSDALLKASSSLGVEAPVTLDTSNAIYAKDASFRDYSVPGITAFVVFILTFILTLLAFVSERTSGSLERLQATPLRESELVMGYALAFSAIAVVQTAMVLAVIVGVFKVMVVGSILLAFVVIALLAVLSLSLGILLSSVAKREAQAIQCMPIVALPVFLLGGVFWPIEGIPEWLRPLSYAIPPTYAVNATRAVMLRGWGIGQIWIDLLAMLGFTVAFLGLSVWMLHRQRAR